MSNTSNLNERLTENAKQPKNVKSIIWKTIGIIIVMSILIGLILFYTLPRNVIANISNIKYLDGNLVAAATINGRSGQFIIDLENSSFQTNYTSGLSLSVSIFLRNTTNSNGQSFFISAIRPTDASTNETVFNIANLSINQTRGIATLVTEGGSYSAVLTNNLTALPKEGMMFLPSNFNIDTANMSSYLSAGRVKGIEKLLSAGNVQLPDQSAAILTQFLVSIVPFLILLFIYIFLARRFSRSMGAGGIGEEGENVFTIGKSQAKLAKSTYKFSDVAGIEEEKSELIELVDYLKRPAKYVQMGARTPRGVVLYGPPGTGKTLLAKAVAGEAGVPFFQVTGSAFEDMLVGVGAKRVRNLFAKAKKAAPCIIFIDEIDSVGSKRGKYEISAGSATDQTLNQLLAEMDGFSTRTGIIVMAATNRLDVLDDALLRPGRFDRHIQVNLPDIKEREAILKIHSKNKNISSKVNLQDIARRTPGFSGAQLENVLNEATLLAVRADRTSITISDIDEAIDRVIAGPAKKSRVISEFEKNQVAHHEAGHALVGLHLKGADEVQKITIIPRGQAGGYTLSTPKNAELNLKKKTDLLNMIAGALGGRASEEYFFGKDAISTGASNDFYKATNIAKSMVTQLGMSELGITQFLPSEGGVNPNAKYYSEDTARRIDGEISKILENQYKVAYEIIKNNEQELKLIVEALLLQETIVKNDIDYIHEHLKLPEAILKIKAEQEKADKPKEESKEDSDNKPTDSDSQKESEPQPKAE
ncbi:ATP-dependent zinc metalloprotease FtsH [Mycoplasma bradburyae]|uniref:ATP-dependent zinc metalloprotease FtsH n=1 Tax=Mycoplasma bradburyae TaxID=2963128 RepID=UPI00233FE06A|nr:ATP-dependent zinc metalloprotease FtsH [Mycoplasma bradburyae]MDC4184043.1 ATP-dependent zinc metalloprotease FtsH [Mycoplasma bradburyae]